MSEGQVLDQYLPLLVMLILAGLFTGLSFFASHLLGPNKRSNPAKVAPYECGLVPDREPAERFPVRFYLVAMVFIVVDIEIIFLYPWAVVYRSLGSYGLWAMLVFAALFFETFVYLLAKGALTWGPAKHMAPAASASAQAGGRTMGSTIRRVGTRLPVGVDGGRPDPSKAA